MSAEPSKLRAAFEQALLGHYPGFELADRDLVLPALGPHEPAAHADVVLCDRQGRIVLGLLVEGASEDASASALSAAADLLVVARARAGLLARHLGLQQPASGPAQIVVAAPGFAPRVERSLALLAAAGLVLCELVSVRSARGQAYQLVELSGPAAPAPAVAASADFVGGLPESTRPAADLALRRLARIDPELACAVEGDRLRWSFRDMPVCTLASRAGRLEGRLASEAQALDLGDVAAVEEFVDRVLRQLVQLLPDDQREERALDTEREGGADLGARASILTAEELAAFRD